MGKSLKYKNGRKGGKRGKRRNSTKSIKKIRNETMKKPIRYLENSKKSQIIKIFLEMINIIKLYHWKTHSYSEHKATDEIHGRISSNVDKFVEILLGKDESRVKMITDKLDVLDMDNVKEFKDKIYKYREFLIDMNIYFDSRRDSDLLNIRDEILGDLNQFLYLLTLS